jgi:hypothetical protein
LRSRSGELFKADESNIRPDILPRGLRVAPSNFAARLGVGGNIGGRSNPALFKN